MNKYLLILLIAPLLFTSCMSKKKIVYLQGNPNTSDTISYNDPVIQKDDRISIKVTTLEREASIPFNMDTNNSTGVNSNNTTMLTGYLVDQNGAIEFPVLGTLPVAGHKISELNTFLKQKLSKYLKDPVVNIRIMNYKVTVLGEVSRPGIQTFESNRVTLFDALSSAGDLTIYGKRENILLVRDVQGVKTYNRIDITKADFVNSPFYYLNQNDLIYVEMRKAKMDASALPQLGVTLAVFSVILSTIILISK